MTENCNLLTPDSLHWTVTKAAATRAIFTANLDPIFSFSKILIMHFKTTPRHVTSIYLYVKITYCKATLKFPNTFLAIVVSIFKHDIWAGKCLYKMVLPNIQRPLIALFDVEKEKPPP